MELDTLGDQRTALFLIMSDTDDTFNFLISLCYTQLFNLLCEKADDVYGGRLPVHVRCLIDEAANIGQIPKLEKLMATIRSREISACLVLQAQSQLKAIYKDNADPLSRLYQRQRIKREYIAAKAGRSASLSGNAASKAVRRRPKPFAGKKKHVYLVLALVAMLGVLLNAMSSCAPLLEAGMQAFVMGTYPAEEADIKAVERAYRQMEKELQDEMEHYARYHPGHDEYIVQAQDIWHDPHALIRPFTCAGRFL